MQLLKQIVTFLIVSFLVVGFVRLFAAVTSPDLHTNTVTFLGLSLGFVTGVIVTWEKA